MAQRLDVTKTYKLFVDGKFPRSESGRTLVLSDAKGRALAHVCRASRKDVRDAVTAARKGLGPWSSATAYNRGQVLYRIAEMMEGKREEFAAALTAGGLSPAAARAEVVAAIDRVVHYAGWADKYAQVLGCNNAVAGPYYNFTVPQPLGVVGIIAPDAPGLLGLVSLILPVLCAGNTVVVLGGEGTSASLATVILGEVMATSDVPAGTVNLLTGDREELCAVFAGHRDVDGLHAFAGPGGLTDQQRTTLREGAAENIKRVLVRDMAPAGVQGRSAKAGGDAVRLSEAAMCESPWWIEPFVEFKTIWHPSAV